MTISNARTPQWPDAAPPALPFLDTATEAGDLGQFGAYRILELLGQGGMGLVLKAVDPVLNRHVALKVMRPELAAAPVQRARFLREAQAMAALQHDGIVAILEVGEHAGLPFLVMPLLQGETLETRLRRAGPLPYREVLRIGRETATALAAAHERGLIHRDIKPDNLWLDAQQDKVRLLDFGLARPLEGDLGATSPGGVVGTAHYMAPEQARGETLDARADLFSLGCTLYRAGTGQLPFPGDNLFAIFTALASTEPTPPQQLNRALPRDFSALVLQLLQKDRERRSLSAQDVATALGRLDTPSQILVPTRRPKRRSLLLGVLLLLALVGAALHLIGKVNPGTSGLADQGSPAPGTSQFDTPDAPLYTLPDCYHAAFSPDDRLIVTCGAWLNPPRAPGFLCITESASGKRLVRQPHGVTDAFLALFAPDGKRLYQAGRIEVAGNVPGFVHVWNWDGDALRFHQALEHNLLEIGTLALSPDGKYLAAGGSSTTALVWRTTFLKEAFRLEHRDHVMKLAFSPDGRLLASASRDGAVRLWNLQGKRVALQREHRAAARAVLWSGDGRTLFTAGEDRIIRQWDLSRLESQAKVFAQAPEGIRSLAFSPNGQYLVSGDCLEEERCNDSTFGRVRVWSLAAGQELASFPAHARGHVAALNFSRDGTRLLTAGGYDRLGKVWETPPWLLASPEGRTTP